MRVAHASIRVVPIFDLELQTEEAWSHRSSASQAPITELLTDQPALLESARNGKSRWIRPAAMMAVCYSRDSDVDSPLRLLCADHSQLPGHLIQVYKSLPKRNLILRTWLEVNRTVTASDCSRRRVFQSPLWVTGRVNFNCAPVTGAVTAKKVSDKTPWWTWAGSRSWWTGILGQHSGPCSCSWLGSGII